MMRLYLLVLFLILGYLTGCSMMPEYKRPNPPIPKTFSNQGIYKKIKYKNLENPINNISYKRFFRDDKLKKIIEIGLLNNRDLRLAVLNVEYARMYYGIKRADIFPSLYATGIRKKERIPDDLSPTKRGYTQGQYGVNLGIAEWEIDFFGRIKSLSKEALEKFFAEEENKRAVRISLISEIARTYFTLSSDMERLKIIREIVASREENYRLIKSKYMMGIATEVEISMAKSQLDEANLKLIQVKQDIERDKNGLTLLVGEKIPKDLLPKELSKGSLLEPFPPGLSSDILLGRPDIMAAEHRLKAAYADIGAARALLFPKISLTSAIGVASDELSRLFKTGSNTWNYGLTISLPLLDARVWKAYKLSKVQREIVLTQYEKTIQSAFREIMDLLCVKATIEDEIRSQSLVVDSLKKTYKIALQRYNQGIDSYLTVLDAKQSLLDGMLKLTGLRLTQIVNQIKLYAALGGGDR